MNIVESTRHDQARTLDSLADCETAIAELYEHYARLLPESRSVWTTISEDERHHATALRSLHSVLQRGYIFANLDRFGHESILATTRMAQQAMQPACTARQAFATALRIESVLFESSFYNVVVSDAPEFRTVAGALSRETRGHVAFLTAQMRPALAMAGP